MQNNILLVVTFWFYRMERLVDPFGFSTHVYMLISI